MKVNLWNQDFEISDELSEEEQEKEITRLRQIAAKNTVDQMFKDGKLSFKERDPNKPLTDFEKRMADSDLQPVSDEFLKAAGIKK